MTKERRGVIDCSVEDLLGKHARLWRNGRYKIRLKNVLYDEAHLTRNGKLSVSKKTYNEVGGFRTTARIVGADTVQLVRV